MKPLMVVLFLLAIGGFVYTLVFDAPSRTTIILLGVCVAFTGGGVFDAYRRK
jgi:hypothetical protein